MESFEKIKNLTVDGYLLVHGGFVNDKTIIDQHSAKITEIKDTLFAFIKQSPLSIDELTQKIMQKYSIMDNMIAFTLTQTAVKAHISYLESEKMITLIIKDGLLQVTTNL